MRKRLASSVNGFLIILSALTVQADDVSITNPSNEAIQFRVVIQGTGYDRMVTLQPGETQNAIGTDLWHNVRVDITGLTPTASGVDYCRLVIEERNIREQSIIASFYLPEVINVFGYSRCSYTSNIPTCGCFSSDRTADCEDACVKISNAQVFVSNRAVKPY